MGLFYFSRSKVSIQSRKEISTFRERLIGHWRNMSRKQNTIKKGKDHFSLTRGESDELQMILDRLAVQDPEGESFEGYLHSLRNSLSGRPLLAAVAHRQAEPQSEPRPAFAPFRLSMKPSSLAL